MPGVAEKILKEHISEGKFEKGNEVEIKIDQTLTQDATGTMVYLELESMGIKKIKTESFSYVDHNILQTDYRNADDHRFLQTIAEKYGITFSKPGQGICHQLHLERFAIPGKTLLGSDSHTPTAGGVGMIAIGAGGLDVAVAMATGVFYLKVQEILNFKLIGKLRPFVSAKDIILEVLRQLNVDGGVGKILEFHDVEKNLSVPERATITNMGTETGATTSIFPSDEKTLEFLRLQQRENSWKQILPDKDADYDKEIEINLNELEPLIALPHSPGNVKKVREIEEKEIHVDQVCIGSCTNSSIRDLKLVANLLKGKKIHKDVDLVISPGSKQVLSHLIETKELNYLLESGARILECACGPCIGMGQAPKSNGVSVRTFNRNFKGRCGTEDAEVYLCSPEVAVACALTGKICSPENAFDKKTIENIKNIYEKLKINTIGNLYADNFIKNGPNPKIEIYYGKNIKPLPKFKSIIKDNKVLGKVILKLGDDISTDDIMPAGSKILPLRSNLPEISKFTFSKISENFYNKAINIKNEGKNGIIVAGKNYGQGSSREHAALAPRFLGISAIIAKSFARIHSANLINFGILPLMFVNEEDYENIDENDDLEIDVTPLEVQPNKFRNIKLKNLSKKLEIQLKHNLSKRDIDIIKIGGKLNYASVTNF